MDQRVDPLHDDRRPVPVERVCAQRRAELRHHRRRGDAVPDHVARGDGDAAAGERERVVPVAAQARAAGGQVAAGELDPGDAIQVGQQAALQDIREPALLVERGVLDRDRHPVGRELQQITLIIGEQPTLQAAHVQHPQHPILRQQRNPQQRPDPLLAQDRIQDVGMIDIVDP